MAAGLQIKMLLYSPYHTRRNSYGSYLEVVTRLSALHDRHRYILAVLPPPVVMAVLSAPT